MKATDEEELQMAAAKFRPGIYAHYKGGTYAALLIVRHHQTRQPMVVYTSIEKGNVQVRELDQPEYRGGIRVLEHVDAWTDEVDWNYEGVPCPNAGGPPRAARFVFLRSFA